MAFTQSAETSSGLSIITPVVIVWMFGVIFSISNPSPKSTSTQAGSFTTGGTTIQSVTSERHWEDPLEAVSGLDAFARTEPEKVATTIPGKLKGPKHDLILFVPVRGSTYTENKEYRCRQRYALQAALWSKNYYRDANLAALTVDAEDNTPPLVGKGSINIPWESFTLNEHSKDNEGKSSLPHRICVMYLNANLIQRLPSS